MTRPVGLLSTALLALPALPLTGCAMEGSGVLETRSFELPPFDAVAIGHGADLELGITPEATATITLDDNLFDALRVEVDDSTLRIELAGGYSYTGVNLSARVELPSLRGLELSGDSWARAGLQGEPRLYPALSCASKSRARHLGGNQQLDLRNNRNRYQRAFRRPSAILSCV